ncbi:MAG: LolA-like putative outer membrane lipoprotein chaperone [Prevotella sp.]|nr:cell envelope biogenesis protein LolA [Prevotella sp.]MDY4217731.1 LolA-like putative outer membrane lipoprotein chaperone [Prevotella sp.]
MKIKKEILTLFMLLACLFAYGQSNKQAMTILDKCLKKTNIQSGLSANFTISSKSYGKTSGSTLLKGNKFKVITPESTIWFNGKTQWTYLKATDEVNITTPNSSEWLALNPYSFISLYKQGYSATPKTINNTYQVHLKATSKTKNIQELYLLIGKDYSLRQVKLLHGKEWITLTITSLKSTKLSDTVFVFNKKDYPKAEIIDLR